MSQYFRNKRTIAEIEAESLWELADGYFILVDNDEHFSLPENYYKDDFYEVDPPAELKKPC